MALRAGVCSRDFPTALDNMMKMNCFGNSQDLVQTKEEVRFPEEAFTLENINVLILKSNEEVIFLFKSFQKTNNSTFSKQQKNILGNFAHSAPIISRIDGS